MAILSKKKKNQNLKGFCFLVFMLFLKQINLKFYLIFATIFKRR
ncbi:membrane protein [Helicobacter pylori CG-IMSS-2012]|nr:membrane protein [Helicobacter pylori CG-IMSS-2012]